MSSPRTMWSGTVKLGLTSFSISVGKSWADEREKNLRDVCSCHGEFIDRTERCTVTNKAPDGKAKGVELESGKIQTLTAAEYAAIEDASASDELTVIDYQPVYELPLEFGTGTYYVRYNPPKKKSTVGLDVMATFCKALAQADSAAIVMWKRAGSHKLCALHVASTGELLLTQLPLASEFREAGEVERRHLAVQTDKAAVAMFQQLLTAIASEEFDHERFENEAMKLRSEAVEKILAAEGEGDQKQDEKQESEEEREERLEQRVPDLMQQLRDSMKQVEQTDSEKENA